MPSLQIRDLPEELYKALKGKAEKERRSIAQQAVVSLSEALQLDINYKENRKDYLKKLKLKLASRKHLEDVNPNLWIVEDRKR